MNPFRAGKWQSAFDGGNSYPRSAAQLAVAWPFGARAQQSQPTRRIGVLMNRAVDDREGQAEVVAFQQALQKLGWSDGGNVRLDIRWGKNDADDTRSYAAELVALTPDVCLTAGALSVAALQHLSRNLPIVFVQVADPVGAGLVDTLDRPGGSTTGFMLFEYSLSAKWLELLKEIAPNVTRAAVIRDSTNPSGIGQFSAVQGAAQSLGVEVSPIGVRDAGEIERAVVAFTRSANGGLIVTGSAGGSVHRDLIVMLAARHKLPAVYADGYIVAGGGLIGSISSGVPQATSTAFSRARRLPICRCRRPSNTSLSLTSKPPRRLA